ncbi:hypothetical protein SDC9_54961 [bioreactor metagenome]|uniref:Uncharacterized protein n=1 Tax=bioreactor metagenome TaxID=1076179 RepID=A0A644WY72_9ZZZZ
MILEILRLDILEKKQYKIILIRCLMESNLINLLMKKKMILKNLMVMFKDLDYYLS